MKIPRVVFDTHVVVSAALGSQELPAKLLALVATGKISLYLSEAAVQEYTTVFARSKFAHIDPALLRRLIGLLNRSDPRRTRGGGLRLFRRGRQSIPRMRPGCPRSLPGYRQSPAFPGTVEDDARRDATRILRGIRSWR